MQRWRFVWSGKRCSLDSKEWRDSVRAVGRQRQLSQGALQLRQMLFSLGDGGEVAFIAVGNGQANGVAGIARNMTG